MDGTAGSDANSILRGLANGITRNGVITILINPQHAKTLADAGWTKEKIVNYICQDGRKETMRRQLKPEEIRLVVAGGSGGLGVCIISGGGSWATQRVTKKIGLPKNWDELVAKYRDVVPRYDTQ
jgi:hypothetical protein